VTSRFAIAVLTALSLGSLSSLVIGYHRSVTGEVYAAPYQPI
jgi:hypothetical protein